MKKYHLYFAACDQKEGGVYHYTMEDQKLTFVKKTDMPSPLYLDVTKDDMEVVLRFPKEGVRESGIQNFPLKDFELQEPGEITMTKGGEGCHLCRFEGNVYVANYGGGSVFSSAGKVDIHEGHGTNPRRQERPHSHYVNVAPDGKYLLSVDLGLDTIFTYDKDLNVVHKAQVPGGYGCRHLAYSEDGKFVFCANELDGSVSVFAYDDGVLTYLNTCFLYDVHPVEGNTTGAIRVQGDYVYVTGRSRGDITNDITVLKWDGQELTKLNQVKCGGQSPRDILIVDSILFSTNEFTNNVTMFKVDGAELTKLPEELEMVNPLCIVAVEE